MKNGQSQKIRKPNNLKVFIKFLLGHQLKRPDIPCKKVQGNGT